MRHRNDNTLSKRYKIVISFLTVVAVIITISSCIIEDTQVESNEYIIKGSTRDVFRNIISTNIKIVLYEEHYRGTFPQIQPYGVKVDSTMSNSNGSFYINYIRDNKRKHFIRFFDNSFNEIPYYFEPITSDLEINYYGRYNFEIFVNLEKENIIDINAYHPIVLRVETSVVNNTNNWLVSRSSESLTNIPYYSYDVSQVVIKNESIDTLYYLRAKPLSEMKIFFYYAPNPGNNSHTEKKIFSFQTSINDTIAISYSIDCSTF